MAQWPGAMAPVHRPVASIIAHTDAPFYPTSGRARTPQTDGNAASQVGVRALTVSR